MSLVMGRSPTIPRWSRWAGFRRHFEDRGLSLDFVLYSHYERQVEDLINGAIVAWNSPLA